MIDSQGGPKGALVGFSNGAYTDSCWEGIAMTAGQKLDDKAWMRGEGAAERVTVSGSVVLLIVSWIDKIFQIL